MKLLKKLQVNGADISLVTDDVRLELHSPGRASLRVVSSVALSGIVTLDLGYSHQSQLHRWFTGFIEKSVTVSNNEQQLFCRELSAILNRRLPISLRHATLRTVLADISRQSGLRFNVPKAAYSDTRTPYFFSMGGGYHCMDAIGQVFNISDYIWQQQGNGEIYVGSWADSFWANKPLELPEKLLTGHLPDDGADIPAVPALRPGIQFNAQFYITSITLNESKMRLTWSKQLKR